MLHWVFISQLIFILFYHFKFFFFNSLSLFAFPQHISKLLLFWEDKTKTFFRSNTVFGILFVNSFVTYQNSTFSGIWFNQKLIFRFFFFFHSLKMCN